MSPALMEQTALRTALKSSPLFEENAPVFNGADRFKDCPEILPIV